MSKFMFKCTKCDHQDSYSTNKSLPKALQVPTSCPKCKEGELVKDFKGSLKGISNDVVGGAQYEFGNKAFHKLSDTEQSQLYLGERTY
jgi:hypothetical protein